jgi:hypothetical protein
MRCPILWLLLSVFGAGLMSLSPSTAQASDPWLMGYYTYYEPAPRVYYPGYNSYYYPSYTYSYFPSIYGPWYNSSYYAPRFFYPSSVTYTPTGYYPGYQASYSVTYSPSYTAVAPMSLPAPPR